MILIWSVWCLKYTEAQMPGGVMLFMFDFTMAQKLQRKVIVLRL
jgi:hypothetical protein